VFRNIIGLVRANRDAGMRRSSALSHCSGGIDGRPVVEYRVRKCGLDRGTLRAPARVWSGADAASGPVAPAKYTKIALPDRQMVAHNCPSVLPENRES
jgi:hypothetical protein